MYPIPAVVGSALVRFYRSLVVVRVDLRAAGTMVSSVTGFDYSQLISQDISGYFIADGRESFGDSR